MVMGTSWLVCSCFRGDGILRGAGQSRHQAMRRNARVAFVLGRAGPPRGHEATPDRTVRRPNWGRPICATCSHARLVLVGRNESRALSFMFAVEVNSGTCITRTSRLLPEDLAAPKPRDRQSGAAADAVHSMTTTKAPPGGSGAFLGGEAWGKLHQ